MELNEELRMKGRWLNNRIKLLQKYTGGGSGVSHKMKRLADSVLLRLKAPYAGKAAAELCLRKGIGAYFGEGENKAIPLQMDAGEPIALEMNKGEPIPMEMEVQEPLLE
jgi:hypothetical protein